jgi:hypothetical protein
VPLVLDLHIAHDRVGSSTDPTLNGHWCYPNKLDQSLNDAAADKIRKYRADYNNNPPNTVSFMPAIASTSERLHSEFVRLLFLQAHRETDRLYVSRSTVDTESRFFSYIEQTDRGVFHYLRSAFSSMFKSKVGLALDKAAALRITLNLDGSTITSKSHTSSNPVYERHVDSSSLGFSLSSHRQSYIGLVFSSRFID